MMDSTVFKAWLMRLLLVGLTIAIIFFHLLPLSHLPRRLAGPDLITLMIFAWALRKPAYVPAWLIAAVALLADFMFQRPPGLWAALTVIFAQSLKNAERRQRETNFMMEWLRVSVSLGMMTLIYQFAKLLLIIEPLGWVLAISQLVTSILAYPVVVAITRLFGVSRSALGDRDRLGLGA